MTGIFATKMINPSGQDALIYGNIDLLFAQIYTNLIVIVYSAFITFIIIKVLSLFYKITG